MRTRRDRTTTPWVTRIMVGVAINALVLIGLTDPSAAKGPESATLSGPGVDQPIELTDAADSELFVRLMQQTGLWFSVADPLPLEPSAAELGPSYALSWINSVPPGLGEEERTIHQFIYLDTRLGAVIHTPAQVWPGGLGIRRDRMARGTGRIDPHALRAQRASSSPIKIGQGSNRCRTVQGPTTQDGSPADGGR